MRGRVVVAASVLDVREVRAPRRLVPPLNRSAIWEGVRRREQMGRSKRKRFRRAGQGEGQSAWHGWGGGRPVGTGVADPPVVEGVADDRPNGGVADFGQPVDFDNSREFCRVQQRRKKAAFDCFRFMELAEIDRFRESLSPPQTHQRGLPRGKAPLSHDRKYHRYIFRLFSIYGTSGYREMPRICVPTANPPRWYTKKH